MSRLYRIELPTASSEQMTEMQNICVSDCIQYTTVSIHMCPAMFISGNNRIMSKGLQ